MDLQQLTTLILALSETPLTRIRLTKAIYFAHKELVRQKHMRLEDITYLRLPLGPAPEGLIEVISNQPQLAIQDIPSNLFYENQTYSLAPTAAPANLPPEVNQVVQKTLHLLEPYRTLELIHASQDPSWLAHPNGAKYHLTSADLKNPFPNSQLRFKIHIKTTQNPPQNEIGALQAALLRGMLADIVKESTDLEYPDTPSDKPQNDQDSMKLRRFTIRIPGWPKKKEK